MKIIKFKINRKVKYEKIKNNYIYFINNVSSCNFIFELSFSKKEWKSKRDLKNLTQILVLQMKVIILYCMIEIIEILEITMQNFIIIHCIFMIQAHIFYMYYIVLKNKKVIKKCNEPKKFNKEGSFQN